MGDRVLVFNGWGSANESGPELAAWVRRVRARVAIISELGHLDDDLRHVGRVFANRGDRPRDVAVVITGPVARLVARWSGGRLTRFVRRPGASKPRLWRDRWYVRVRVWRRVNYALHANAAIQHAGRWNGTGGARVWKAALREVDAMVRRDQARGLSVRIGADMNFPASPAEWSPNRWFDSLGLEYLSDGRVMWVAWDPRRERAVRRHVLVGRRGRTRTVRSWSSSAGSGVDAGDDTPPETSRSLTEAHRCVS